MESSKSVQQMTTKKRDRKQLRMEEEEIPELPDLRNPFFERIVRAALDGESSIEHLVSLCQKYGKLHGENLRKKYENSSSYSKVYVNSRRLSRGQTVDSVDDLSSKNDIDVKKQMNRDLDRNDLYSHPFFKMYHNNKHLPSLSSTRNQDIINTMSNSYPLNIDNSSKRSRQLPLHGEGWDTSTNEKEGIVNSGNDISEGACPQRFTVKRVEGMKGIEMILDDSCLSSNVVANRYMAFLTLLGRRIDLGEFPRDREAALAHDRSLIRALGPACCPQDQLNFPISSYAHDALESFMRYDTVLKRALSGTSWDGLKDCDFGFLLVQSMHKSPSFKKRKSLPSSSISPPNLRRRTALNNGHSDDNKDDTDNDGQDISSKLHNNLKPPTAKNNDDQELLYFKRDN